MSKAFVLHTPESAPGNAGPVLADSKRRLGFIPNLYAVLAESPEALDGYIQPSGIFARTTRSPAEQHVVMQFICGQPRYVVRPRDT